MPRGIYPHRKGIIKGVYKRRPLLDRFIEKIELFDKTECWNWNGYKNKKGYGTINIEGRKACDVLAHRASYTLFIGVITNGMLVLHKCDNPSCVNPDHLFQGTAKDNTQDAINKGRQFWQKRKKALLCPTN